MMPCYHPKKAWRSCHAGQLNQLYFGDKPRNVATTPFNMPCGNCIGCRIDRENSWAQRIMDEASCHDDNQYITLTYNEENMPADYAVNLRDTQLFMKRLRKHFKGKTIRFVDVAEYGSCTLRAHYHYALFGLPLLDLEFKCSNDEGDPLYTSQVMEKIWGKGDVIIGELTLTSAAYIARYLLKDQCSDKTQPRPGEQQWKDDYSFLTPEGELLPRKKPFFNMSRNPGIGKKWIDEFMWDCFPHDYRIVDGQKRPVPDYYLKQLEKVDPEMATLVKQKRSESLFDPQQKAERSPRRLSVRETCKLSKMGKDKKRLSRVV